MTYRLAAMSLLIIVGVTASSSGQSLAELARREEARRQSIKTPAKVYTNENIRGGTPARTASPAETAPPATAATPPAGAPPAGATTPETGSGVAAVPAQAAPATTEETKGEAYWKKRIQGERDALARAQVFAEALQSRINALSADFVARDDPAQRAVIATDRQKALAELERVKQEIAQHTKGIAAVQDEARRAGVPPGWLR